MAEGKSRRKKAKTGGKSQGMKAFKAKVEGKCIMEKADCKGRSQMQKEKAKGRRHRQKAKGGGKCRRQRQKAKTDRGIYFPHSF